MKKFEYQVVSPTVYEGCLRKSSELLERVSKYWNKPIINLTPLDIFAFFEESYDILFAFFESDSKAVIKYEDIVKNCTYRPFNENLVKRMSGVTIPQDNHFVVMLNQTMPRPRIIFTLLHELSHLYFHNLQSNRRIFTSKFSGNYPNELIPYENEANVIASLLFCPTEKLELLLCRGYSFQTVQSIAKMSRKGLHTRLLNYLHHIIGLPHKVALGLVLSFKDGDKSSASQIENHIKKKNFKRVPIRSKPIKTSRGIINNRQACKHYLHKLSTEDLIIELDYAHHYHNQELELLILETYYQKQK